MMILAIFQGSVGKTGTGFFSDPFQMSPFVCDFPGSFPCHGSLLYSFSKFLKMVDLLIKTSLFSRTTKDLISFLYIISHFPGIWRGTAEVYMCLGCHLYMEIRFLTLIRFLIYKSFLSNLQDVYVDCCIASIHMLVVYASLHI